ncbi:MAG TPA: hypothetical protein VGO60_01835 [Iamia sp.]|jgi:hypothetical protein|nr:hypothetical protein [Iamia sp.]
MDVSTKWSRRSMLVLSATAAGAALVAGPLGSAAAGAAAPAGTTGGRAVTGLRRDHWTPLVGKKVTVDGPAGRVRATVAGVEDLRGAPAGDAGAFAVELRTDRGAAVSGLLPITIPGRGVTTLLLSAVDRGVTHRSSQIVVNNPAH